MDAGSSWDVGSLLALSTHLSPTTSVLLTRFTTIFFWKAFLFCMASRRPNRGSVPVEKQHLRNDGPCGGINAWHEKGQFFFFSRVLSQQFAQ